MHKIAQKPEDVPHLFAEAWEKRDARMIADLFAEDGNFINVTGLWWDNPEDIFKAHDFGFTHIFPDSTLTIIRLKTTYLAEDVAFVHARMDLTNQTNREGKTVHQTRHCLFVFVVRKEGEQWVCHSAQNSEILVGAQTFERQEDGSYKAVRYGTSEIDYSKYEQFDD